MDEDRVLANQTVLIRNGRISEIGPVNSVAIPKGATKIDASGKFIMPGLADMHAHLFHTLHSEFFKDPSVLKNLVWTDTLRARRRLAQWFANGVTTVRNPDHGYTAPSKLSLMLKAEVANGTFPSPQIYTAGRWRPEESDESFETLQKNWPPLGDIEKHLRAYKAAGYDFVKPYFEPTEVYDSVVIIAKRIGIPVGGHVPLGTSPYHAIRSTHAIDHPMGLWIGELHQRSSKVELLNAVADSMVKANVWHAPTQSHYVAMHGDPAKIGFLGILANKGGKILLSTDEPPFPGLIARELASLVTEGLTPFQALSTGTRNVAQFLGNFHDAGTVEVGKRADLVLLSANPLVDVAATAEPVGVMVGGRWYTKAQIDARIDSLKK